MTAYMIGIDGGGTSCRAAVADKQGHILGRARSGAANILTDPDMALSHILEAVRLAFEDAGLDSRAIADAKAVLGVAGNNVGDAVSYIRERLPFASADIVSDALIALQGALGDRDGAVAILGTGTIYMQRLADKISHIGGWGFAVGDHGSGARLGHALLQESLLAFDGIHPASPLTDTVLAEFSGDPGAVVKFARQAHPGTFGAFAPRVFTFAETDDPVALALIKGAAASIDEALDALVRRGVERICLLGGLAPLYRPFLAARHQPLISEPEADALTGAVALAIRAFGACAEPATAPLAVRG